MACLAVIRTDVAQRPGAFFAGRAPSRAGYPASCTCAGPRELYTLSPAASPYDQPAGLGSPDGTSSFAG